MIFKNQSHWWQIFFFMCGAKCVLETHHGLTFWILVLAAIVVCLPWHSWWAWPGWQSPQRAHGTWWVMSKLRVSSVSNCQNRCRCEGHQCFFGVHVQSSTKLLRDIPECWHQEWMNFSHQCCSLLEPFRTAPRLLTVISAWVFPLIISNILSCSHCTSDIGNTAHPLSPLKYHAFEAVTLLSYSHSSPSPFLSSKHFLF